MCVFVQAQLGGKPCCSVAECLDQCRPFGGELLLEGNLMVVSQRGSCHAFLFLFVAVVVPFLLSFFFIFVVVVCFFPPCIWVLTELVGLI